MVYRQINLAAVLVATICSGVLAAEAGKLEYEYVGFRPAKWETEKVTEVEKGIPNEAGFITVYFRNTTDETIRLAHWHANGWDESYWRLEYFIAWDRLYDTELSPGELGVLEICALRKEFAEGTDFDFSIVEREAWRSTGTLQTTLREDPVQISLIHFEPGLREVEIHLRNKGAGKVRLNSIEIDGREIESAEWKGAEMNGPSNAIARIVLKEPLPLLDVCYVKVGLTDENGERVVIGHRRAFEDFFPIGTWGLEEDKAEIYKSHHIDSCVRGGSSTDRFYSEVARKYGFRTMTPVEGYHAVDRIRDLSGHPVPACWLLYDEPDWSRLPTEVLMRERETRSIDKTHPTFITYCRNVKFFEYAQIPDIPCHDHYSVTAPSTSKWPHPYGTRLDETAYYTRDLKLASEPKPIWVWSQGVHEWSERPKMPLPTADELTAQLWLNIGRGAKGILWFTFDLAMGEKYPETREAVREGGRLLRLIREDLQGSEPYEARIEAPENIDVAALACWDKVFLFVFNQDYDIHPEAYPWRRAEGVKVALDLPSWIDPVEALELTPEGIESVSMTSADRRVTVDLGTIEVCRILALSTDPAQKDKWDQALREIVADERVGGE